MVYWIIARCDEPVLTTRFPIIRFGWSCGFFTQQKHWWNPAAHIHQYSNRCHCCPARGFHRNGGCTFTSKAHVGVGNLWPLQIKWSLLILICLGQSLPLNTLVPLVSMTVRRTSWNSKWDGFCIYLFNYQEVCVVEICHFQSFFKVNAILEFAWFP